LKGSLGATLRAARPTFFFGVPRVWEKMQEAMLKVGASNGWLKQKIAGWAKGQGTLAYNAAQVGGDGSR
jgi:long-chain-fatty-acid--CoA ligase ACSBG